MHTRGSTGGHGVKKEENDFKSGDACQQIDDLPEGIGRVAG